MARKLKGNDLVSYRGQFYVVLYDDDLEDGYTFLMTGDTQQYGMHGPSPLLQVFKKQCQYHGHVTWQE